MAECGEYLEVVKKLALEAGEVLKSGIILKIKNIETKSNEYDLVTEYDRNIEKMLVKGLSEKFPDHKFIAEESTGLMPELTDSPTWLIDPIDGTKNFVHGFPQCCISIGLTVKKRPELGLIYNPSNNEMYTAIRGEGAYLNGKRIETSKVTELKKSLIYIVPAMIRASSNNPDIGPARFKALLFSAQGIRIIGSGALGLAYVASGIFDAVQIDNLAPWDVAAGTLIVEEAGGTVIDTEGGPHDIMKPKTIAASTESLAKEISNLIVDTDLQTQQNEPLQRRLLKFFHLRKN